jgi:hypothetical protein
VEALKWLWRRWFWKDELSLQLAMEESKIDGSLNDLGTDRRIPGTCAIWRLHHHADRQKRSHVDQVTHHRALRQIFHRLPSFTTSAPLEAAISADLNRAPK